MAEIMDIDGTSQMVSPDQHELQDEFSGPCKLYFYNYVLLSLTLSSPFSHLAPTVKDNFREIQVKVHIRQPDKDSWLYLGRGIVTQEISGQSSRVGEFYLPALHHISKRYADRLRSGSTPGQREANHYVQ